jgi:hypothetical protein
MEEQLPIIACGNPQAQQMFRRGGTYTYRITDSGGEQFKASVNRCSPRRQLRHRRRFGQGLNRRRNRPMLGA